MVNNPYIEKVKVHENIMVQSDDIYERKGKWDLYFGNSNPIVLEIGTGMGNFFSKQVNDFADKNFVGMEIRYKRLYHTAEKSRKTAYGNFVVLKEFGQNIKRVFAKSEITETYIFFPDPWEKKDKQKKHRIMQEAFLKDLHYITDAGGKVYFKTDHREYFDSTLEVIKEQGLWNINIASHNYEKEEFFDMENLTEFEGLYRGEKKEINYLELEKC